MKKYRPVLRLTCLVSFLLLISSLASDTVFAFQSPPPSQKEDRVWLGVAMQTVTPALAEAFGLVEAAGVLVADIKPDSPASKGGIERGDVIIKFNKHYIREIDDLPKIIAVTPPGKMVDVDVIRNRKVRTLSITLTILKFPKEELDTLQSPLGMQLQDITPKLAQMLKLVTPDGALVTNVIPGEPADDAGLQRGDVITAINDKPVHNVADYHSIASKIKGKTTVLFLVKRGPSTLFVAVNKD